MTQFTAIHLQLRSGLHVGAHSADLAATAAQVPSDTLFAALLTAYRLAGGAARDWSAAFAHDPPFLLTSAFPRVGDVRFYPLPVARLFADPTSAGRGKELKRLAYFSEELLRRRLAGRLLDAALFPQDAYTDPTDGAALQDGALWLTTAETPRLPEPLRKLARAHPFALRRQRVWTTERVPRVAVGRSASDPTLFHSGRVAYAPGCGLWFGVLWRDPDRPIGDRSARAAFARALAHLQESGLGGERSVGYGAFEAANPAPLSELPAPRPGALAYLLSRYHPTPADLAAGALADPAVAYQTVRVGGFLGTPDGPAQLRRSVRLLEAGSVIAWPAQTAVPGDLVDVSPQTDPPFPHPVWRYGYALGAAFPPLEASRG